MNDKHKCKYYDKYENACRISSCSCGATLRECEHRLADDADDDDDVVDIITTGIAIASTISSLGVGNIWFDDSSLSDPSSDWSGGGGDSGGGGSDSSW